MLARYAIVGYSEDKTATHFAYIQTNATTNHSTETFSTSGSATTEALQDAISRVKSCQLLPNTMKTRMWANAQPDGRPAEHRWRPLFKAAKFG